MVLVRHMEAPNRSVGTNQVVSGSLVGMDEDGVALTGVHVHTGCGDRSNLDAVNLDDLQRVIVNRDKNRGGCAVVDETQTSC